MTSPQRTSFINCSDFRAEMRTWLPGQNLSHEWSGSSEMDDYDRAALRLYLWGDNDIGQPSMCRTIATRWEEVNRVVTQLNTDYPKMTVTLDEFEESGCMWVQVSFKEHGICPLLDDGCGGDCEWGSA